MSTDKKIDQTTEDQITEAGAVELDEGQLDNVSGGIIAVAPELKINTYDVKLNTIVQKV